MITDQNWLLGVVIAVLSALPIVAVMALTEVRKFAGFRKKLADQARRILPFAVIDNFEHVYGSDRVRAANKKALLDAKALGAQQRRNREKR